MEQLSSLHRPGFRQLSPYGSCTGMLRLPIGWLTVQSSPRASGAGIRLFRSISRQADESGSPITVESPKSRKAAFS